MKNKSTDDDDLEDVALVECPKCLESSAELVEGRWECSNGCDLTGCHECARCGALFQGAGPFCSETCVDPTQA